MQEISTKLQDIKINALVTFVEELIKTLESQGFTVSEFWLACSIWAEHSEEWKGSVLYLENAANPPKVAEKVTE